MWQVSCLHFCRIMRDPWDAWSGKDTGVSRYWHTFWLCFSGLLLSQQLGTLPRQCHLLIQISFSLLVQGDHPDQAGCSTAWLEKISFSLYILWYTQPLIAFPLELWVYSCHHLIVWNRKMGCLVLGISVFIGQRLQWVMGVLLCLVVVLFYDWQYIIPIRAKLSKVYVQAPGRLGTYA